LNPGGPFKLVFSLLSFLNSSLQFIENKYIIINITLHYRVVCVIVVNEVRKLEVDKEILKGYIDTIILSLLNDKSLYGYELAKEVRLKSKGTFELKEGTMYLALKRLESNELIQAYWGEGISEGGRRKYYRILPAGNRRYLEKKQEWNFVKETINYFLGE